MSDKKFLENINPERREFLEKVTKGAFIIPAVISVMMLNQKLNLTTANAVSNDGCLPSCTTISVPGGSMPITELKPGMPVFTLDLHGKKVVSRIELVSKVLVPGDHMMCHLILDDGRELHVSAGHPTADNRRIGGLSAGDVLDGAEIISIVKIPYDLGYTYDLLPSGETGLYWADGVLLGSTLSSGSKFHIGSIDQPEAEAYSG